VFLLEKKFPLRYVFLALAGILVQVAAQIVANGAANWVYSFCGVAAVGNAVAAVAYPAAALAGLWALCRTMGGSLAAFRITRVRLSPVWCVSAVLMPALVCGIYLLLPGHWAAAAGRMDAGLIVTSSILYAGIAAGIVEEAVFRGVLMTALERRWGRAAAVLAPSVLFGALHALDGGMDLTSRVLVVSAGTMVGVLFSLVAVETGSIWSGALMHGVWNSVVYGVLHIGPEADQWALFSRVPESGSVWLTGGEFGVEASAVAVAAYVAFTVLAVVRVRQKRAAGCI